jgi:hypothetical protein
MEYKKNRNEGLKNIQINAVIECPKLGHSLEVSLPESIEGSYLVYSISSDSSHKVYLNPFELKGRVGNGRFMTYSSDNLITNGFWMHKEHGRRIC